MAPSLPLESAALKFCRQALRRAAPVGSKPTPSAASARVRLGRVNWMLPELAKLIADHHHRSPCDFALTARQFVDEHTFIEDPGDPVFDEQVNDETQTLVEVSLRVHRVVHHRANAQVDWHHIPVTPLMCG